MAINGSAHLIEHVFVLVLENRSFDHMLGFSGISGRDAETGEATAIRGLVGTESNQLAGVSYVVSQPASLTMPIDPHHEFEDVVQQLSGAGAAYSAGSSYPIINCSGFVANYAASGGAASPAEIMKCYQPAQLPILTALAQEFAVCDSWYSSMPGPTWPNRFFVHAASAGGLDHSPTVGEIAQWETLSGFQFDRGTIFDLLDSANPKHEWRIYADGDFPNVAALKGINNFQVKEFADFVTHVAAPDYTAAYTFVEPNYGDVIDNTFRGGNSQHPIDDVTHGEALLKATYEGIRSSPLWTRSLFIVTWDEHGGFYDHVPPPAAVPPNDRVITRGANQHGFAFTQYGPRVPAVVVSPLIPRGVIDHRPYDHSSIPATVEALFGLTPLTRRDAQANNLASLVSLSTARTDTPDRLPAAGPSRALAPMAPARAASALALDDSVDKGNLPGFLHSALRSDLALARPEDEEEILERFKKIKNRQEARDYMNEVRVRVRAGRAALERRKTVPRKKIPGKLAAPAQTKEARHRSRPAPPLAALSVRRPSRHGAYGWVRDLPDARDFAYAAPLIRFPKGLPPSIDLRSECPPVYDQGQLGSCTGNGIAGAIEFDQRKQGTTEFTPSRLFIYYNERVIEGTINQDSGAQIRDGIKSVATLGAPPEADWPYDITKFSQQPPQKAYDDAKQDLVSSYSRVSQDITQMRGCLAEGYPFVFGFTVYESFESESVAQTGIVPMPGSGEGVVGGHCVVAVGYDDTKRVFVIRNSWGEEWGIRGYCLMPYEYLLSPHLANDFWTIRSVTG